MVLLLTSIILTILTVSLNVKTKMKELFKMNKTLQEEGYYMADFEFKMLLRYLWNDVSDENKKNAERSYEVILLKMPGI